MPGMPVRVIGLFALIAVTSPGVAQAEKGKQGGKPVPRRLSIRMQPAFPKFVLQQAKPVVFGKAVPVLVHMENFTINYGRNLTRVPSNPLITGECKTALERFDRTRSRLSIPKDTKAAKAVLDDLGLELIAVRRALWKAEQRAKKAKASHRVVFEPVLINPDVFATTALAHNVFVFGGGRFRTNHLLIDGKWVADDKTNPFLRGGYRSALVALTQARASLNPVRDPKAARRIVDKLNRMLLDVRRELWKIEQAQKKK